MLIDINSARLQLAKGQHFRLRGASYTRLICASGHAWITVEEEAGDVVMSPGQLFIVPPNRTAMISPLGGSATLDVQCERVAPTA